MAATRLTAGLHPDPPTTRGQPPGLEEAMYGGPSPPGSEAEDDPTTGSAAGREGAGVIAGEDI